MRETVTLGVVFAGLMEHEPIQLVFTKRLTASGRRVKDHTQSVPVLDSALISRLRSDVAPGDELEVVLETDWSAEGVPTVMKSFSRKKRSCASAAPMKAKPQSVAAKSA